MKRKREKKQQSTQKQHAKLYFIYPFYDETCSVAVSGMEYGELGSHHFYPTCEKKSIKKINPLEDLQSSVRVRIRWQTTTSIPWLERQTGTYRKYREYMHNTEIIQSIRKQQRTNLWENQYWDRKTYTSMDRLIDRGSEQTSLRIKHLRGAGVREQC